MRKINVVGLSMWPVTECAPFASIKRGCSYRFYTLTHSSARRASFAVRSVQGMVVPEASGWMWIRAEEA